MEISNNNFIRVWKKSKESQLFNRSLALIFIIGMAVGIGSMYYVYQSKIEGLKEKLLDANQYKDYYEKNKPFRPRI